MAIVHEKGRTEASAVGAKLSELNAMYMFLSALYVGTMAWVWYGIIVSGGENYLRYVIFHIAGFLLAFSISYFIRPYKVGIPLANFVSRFSPKKDVLAFSILAMCALLSFTHWLHMGTVPVIAAWWLADVSDVAKVRSEIGDLSRFPYSYFPTFVIKAAIPVISIYYLAKGRDIWLWVAVAVGLAYALSLMQKSYPLFIVLPLALYALTTRRYFISILAAALGGLSLIILVAVANPSMRSVISNPFETQRTSTASQLTTQDGAVATATTKAGQALSETRPSPNATASEAGPPLSETTDVPTGRAGKSTAADIGTDSVEALQDIVTGLSQRVLFRPGAAALKWLQTFPRVYDYQWGCGYRFIAPFAGCQFVALPTLLYEHYYPRYVADGVKGSMNAAHFVMEYANFGPAGVAAAGALVGIVLLGITVLLSGLELKASIVLNLPFIIALGSTSLHTTLLSGGWLLTILLSLILLEGRPSRATSKEKTTPGFAVRLSHR